MSRIIAGKKAKHNGKVFENFLTLEALKSKFEVIKIQDGCRSLGKHKLIRVNQCFDFMMFKPNLALFIDAKSTVSKVFSKSCINMRQALLLSRIQNNGFIAGYIIHFTNLNTVAFFKAEQLMNLKTNDSLKPTDGLVIGNNKNIDLSLIA